jgi:hypothetical protein
VRLAFDHAIAQPAHPPMTRMAALLPVCLLALGCGDSDGGSHTLVGLDDPGALAVADSGLYVADGGRLLRVPLTGGDSSVLDRADVLHIAADATHVYYAARLAGPSPGEGVIEIRRVAASGGAPTVLATDWPVLDLAVDATHVYWTGPELKRVLKAGGAPELLGQPGASDLSLAADHVVFTTRDAIRRAPIAGGAAESLAEGLREPSDPVVAAGALFWREGGLRGRARLMRAQIGGAAEEVPLEGDASVGQLAWSGDLFAIDHAGERILRIPMSGAPSVLATVTRPSRIAVHGGYVYVSEAGSGGQKGGVRRVKR